MNKSMPVCGRNLHRLVSSMVMMCLVAILSGCATHYVDTATTDVPLSTYKKVDQPKAVQVVFEFQTKGVPNSRATGFFKTQVVDQVKASGLFSSVEEKPVPGGTTLGITVNNVPLTDDAFGKGFVTGLTFGLAGSQVTDGYICTLDYSSDVQGSNVTKTARHAIHTVMGAKGAPNNAEPAKNIEEAVRTMARQIVGTALRDLSLDPAFK
ncbi:MAG: hypothetical protein WAV95_14855 [Azonexus sp.]